MHDQTHPDDERLDALAAGDSDATGDLGLRGHIDGCERCRAVVHDLAVLRVALAELPDLRPTRPLQLLPPVGETGTAHGGWMRRLVAPALVLGGAMVLLGAVNLGGGSAGAPALFGEAAEPAAAAPSATVQRSGGGAEAPVPASSEAAGGPAYVSSDDYQASSGGRQPTDATGDRGDERVATGNGLPGLPLLAGGLVLIVGALILRYVVWPRAG